MKTMLKLLVILALLPLLGACASSTTGMGMVKQTLSDKDFLALSEESRSEYVAAITDEEQALTSKKLAEYNAGRPVHYEDPETGLFRTIQWDKMLGMVYIYPGKYTGAMNMNTHNVITVEATKEGKIKYYPDGRGGKRANVFLANVASEEGVGRLLVRSGTQILSSGFSGFAAAKVYSDAECGDNCGNITLNNGALSSAGAVSTSVSEAATKVTGSIPMD